MNRTDPLNRISLQGRKGGSQDFVPVNDFIAYSSRHTDGERAFEAKGATEPVGGICGAQLIQNPESFLPKRQRRPFLIFTLRLKELF